MRFDMFRYASVLVVCVACNKPKPAVNHERNVPPTELARATQPPPAAQPQPAAVAQTPSPEEPVPVRLQREMDAAAKLTPTTAAEMTSIRPILKCVEKVSDKLKEGDNVRVKVLEVDRQGRVRLSMRNVDAA